MKLKQLASNMTELYLNNGIVILFSYETSVAALNHRLSAGGYNMNAKVNKFYSRTTTKHINKWLEDNKEFGNQNELLLEEIDPSVFDELIKQ